MIELDEKALAEQTWRDLEMAADGTGDLEIARVTLPIAKVRAIVAERRVLSALEALPAGVPDEPVAWLSSLLARIHRDGGHYEAEHGTAKACIDADAIIADLYAAPQPPATAGEPRWEAFLDTSYYDLWAVRPVGETRFNSTFHVRSKDEADALVATLTASPSGEVERLREALRALLDRDERNTCQHDETHRGGFLWEICDQCGAKWADDEGGKPEWKDPPEWVEARAALASEVKP